MSKSLEALKDLAMLEWLCSQKGMLFDWERIRKPLKALEIIKNKKVNIHSWYYNDCNKIPYEIYKQSIMAKSISSELLTKEEYELLKEVLYESDNDKHSI